MCDDGVRISRALRYIHEVKYLGSDPKPLIDKLFTYHNSLMFTHRKVEVPSRTNLPGVFIVATLCEFCVVAWPCPEINKWVDALNGTTE